MGGRQKGVAHKRRANNQLNLLLAEPGEWMRRRACKPEHLELFFPQRGANTAIRMAKDICATCPVQPECLAYALEAGPKLTGVWGGESQRGRARMIRAARATKGANGGGAVGRPRGPQLGAPEAGDRRDGQRSPAGTPDLAGADPHLAGAGVAA